MREHRGCLDSLGTTTRRLLGLRAGLDGPALSRGDAASRLGISRRSAARLERTGLRTLRVACGGGGSAQSAPPRVVHLTRTAPALQPAGFLPAASAPALTPAVQLHKPRGRQSVQGTAESSRPPAGGGAGGGPVSAAATSAPLETDGPGPSLAIVIAICLATLAVLVLVGLRRSAVARQRPAAAPVAAAPEPPREPAATYVPPEPPAEPQPKPTERTSQITRAATVVASSAVGFAVRELIRRRRRR